MRYAWCGGMLLALAFAVGAAEPTIYELAEKHYGTDTGPAASLVAMRYVAEAIAERGLDPNNLDDVVAMVGIVEDKAGANNDSLTCVYFIHYIVTTYHGADPDKILYTPGTPLAGAVLSVLKKVDEVERFAARGVLWRVLPRRTCGVFILAAHHCISGRSVPQVAGHN